MITGYVMLVDFDGPNGTSGAQHSLHTDEGKRSFYDTVRQAILRREAGDASIFSWNEEWQLFKHDDVGEPGVWPILRDGAREIRPAISAAIAILISKGEKKFGEKWADRNVFVLDSTVLGPDGLVEEVVKQVTLAVESPIHSLLFIQGGSCQPN